MSGADHFKNGLTVNNIVTRITSDERSVRPHCGYPARHRSHGRRVFISECEEEVEENACRLDGERVGNRDLHERRVHDVCRVSGEQSDEHPLHHMHDERRARRALGEQDVRLTSQGRLVHSNIVNLTNPISDCSDTTSVRRRPLPVHVNELRLFMIEYTGKVQYDNSIMSLGPLEIVLTTLNSAPMPQRVISDRRTV